MCRLYLSIVALTIPSFYASEHSPDLFTAAATGDIDALRTEIARNAEVNRADEEGRTALMAAAEAGQAAACEVLLAAGAKANVISGLGQTPLSLALSSGSFDTTEKLLARGADPNALTAAGTALHIAVEMGRVRDIELLLSKGGRLEVTDAEGRTPLFVAVAADDRSTASLLLLKGAKADVRSSDDRSPLMLAMQQDNLGLVQDLLTYGANPNVRTDTGTILTDAVATGKAALVEILAAKGADLSAQDEEGRTVLAIAIANKHEGIAEFLKRAGARE